MYYLIMLVIGIFLGFYVKGKIGNNFASMTKDEMDDVREEAREALTERTQMRKEKILEFMKDEVVRQEQLAGCNLKENKQGITRNDVERLLDVSNSTAGRYLDELESENKIKQIGAFGKNVYYLPVK